MRLSTKIIGHLGGGFSMYGLIGGISAILQADYLIGLGLALYNITILCIIQANFKKYNKPKDKE